MTLRILSLGAGVQSTTLALMAAHGEFDHMPDAAIFADTGWEPSATYAHLWNLVPLLPFPVYVASAGNIREDLMRPASDGKRFAAIPAFLEGGGMGRRQCTHQYKLRPIRWTVRELLGNPKGRIPVGTVEMWIGISLDESTRMKPSEVQFITHRWPLIEKRMTRAACLKWLDDHGYPQPPKSACIGCPFHHDRQWKHMRDHHPDEWFDAVAVDDAFRQTEFVIPGARGIRAKQYLHAKRIPLREVNLDPDADQINMFENECEGMCGV